MPKITVYAHTSSESMINAAKKAGLSDKAADYFRYMEEFEIELDVDGENGAVCGGRLLTRFD